MNVNELENKLETQMKHSSAMTLLIENQNIVMIHFFSLLIKNSMLSALPLHCARHTTFSLPKDIALTTQISNKYIFTIYLLAMFTFLFEYETPKVIKVKNVPMGILRLMLQTSVICFVVLYQLWWACGYQKFLDVEASIGTKVKGFSM